MSRRKKGKKKHKPSYPRNLYSNQNPAVKSDPKEKKGIFTRMVNPLSVVTSLIMIATLAIGYLKTCGKTNGELLTQNNWKDSGTLIHPNKYVAADNNDYKKKQTAEVFVENKILKRFHLLLGKSPKKVNGILIPNLSKQNSIVIYISSNRSIVSVEQLRRGIDIFSLMPDACAGNVMLSAIGDRIYASMQFRDIMTNQIIGVMDRNKWKVFEPNVLTLKDKYNDRLEVRDKQNYIVLSMKYTGRNSMRLAGYFLSGKSLAIVKNDSLGMYECINRSISNFNNIAITEIEGIKSVY